MRLIMTVLPSVMLVLAALVLLRYPLSPSRMAEIRSELDAQQAVTEGAN
jgi:Na+/melibiose symporter-like transporter